MALMLTVVLAALFPARGDFAAAVSQVTYGAVSLLFFLYGAKLSLAATLAGLANWRLQLGCLVATFVLFPVLSLGLQSVSLMLLPPAIAIGFLYIGCLPSTVQSSIAFTSIANGNVPGAVCAASLSNLIGVVLSPLLLALLLHRQGGDVASASVILKIAKQILLPFVLGQLCRPVLAGFLNRNKLPLMIVDRGSILLIIYSAFSAGVVGGIWHLLSPLAIGAVIALCMIFLAVAVGIIMVAARLAGLDLADRLALLFCGSTKSLATGLPMAGILFAKQEVALIILPLMLFHLLQLVVMAVLSRRVAAA
jgi:solute carrier family 10 (sodium/bile acid cotransporter), member 7